MAALRYAFALVSLVVVACSRAAAGETTAKQKKIQQAIDRGVSHLKSLQRDDGSWKYTRDAGQDVGMTALAAWTLLEAGIPAADPIIQRAATQLRKECVALTTTYGLSLAIIFFDRLAQPRDRGLIHGMTLRLLAGQNEHGGWFYSSQLPDGKEEPLRRYLAAAGNGPAGKDPSEPIRQLLKTTRPQQTGQLPGDNSNTQFAMLALWVARRHAMPVDRALAAVESRFRRCQHKAGSWGYVFPLSAPTATNLTYGPRPSMTCAGLLGLALGHGIKSGSGKRPDIRQDDNASAGLHALEAIVKSPPGAIDAGVRCYFLFSLERMAVVYDLKAIGGVDWYHWGAKDLLDRQLSDGSWPGDHAAADTCFALLFLRRANVAADLTFELNPIRKNKE